MSSAEAPRVRRSLADIQADYEAGDKAELETLMRAWKGIKDLPPDDARSFFRLGGFHGEPFRGLGAINVRAQRYYHTYHSIQMSLQRRFRNGISGGFNYTLGLSETSNEDLPIRLDHGPDGSVIERADNAEFQELMKDPGLKRHVLRANVVWDLPDLSPGGRPEAARRKS